MVLTVWLVWVVALHQIAAKRHKRHDRYEPACCEWLQGQLLHAQQQLNTFAAAVSVAVLMAIQP
jgi:hypothetical protein